MTYLREPLVRHVAEGMRTVDGEADEEYVGLRIGERPQSIVGLLEQFHNENNQKSWNCLRYVRIVLQIYKTVYLFGIVSSCT
jgi:hypothetical protein